MLHRAAVSAPEVARALHVPPSTAMSMMARLVRRGQAMRVPTTDLPDETTPNNAASVANVAAVSTSRRGRPVVAYGLRLPAPVAVVLFDGSEASGAVVDAGLAVRGVRRQELAAVEGQAGAIALVERMLARVLPAAGLARGDLAGLGLSINAVPLGARTLASSVLPWVDASLAPRLADALGLPVHLVLTPTIVAEHRLLPEPLPGSMVYLRVGDGVSSHFIAGRRCHAGHGSLAGELGHVSLEADGPLCGCGRRGCLEAWCSGPAIVRAVREDLRAGVASTLDAGLLQRASARAAVDHIAQAWRAGDSLARTAMDRVFDRLGRGLAIILNLVDPDLIVVGGYVLRDRPEWIEEVRRRALPWTLHAARRENPLRVARATLEDELRVIACHYHYPLAGKTPPSSALEGEAKRGANDESDPDSQPRRRRARAKPAHRAKSASPARSLARPRPRPRKKLRSLLA
ncbi:MAG: ROK family protein [Planctomycetota bacterium]|nr:ROK family protein [Planctomycetota bacterium]